MVASLFAAPAAGWINPSDPSVAAASMTPQDVARQQALAQALMEQGGSTAPIRSPWQGVAQLAKGLMGGLEMRQASEADAEGRARSSALMAKLLAGGDAPAVTPQASALAAGLAGTDGAAAPGASLPTFAMGQGSTPAVTPSSLAPMFAAKEDQYGLPSGYLSRTAGIESSFNPNAFNPGSGAKGMFEFVPSTAKAYGLTNPMDPDASTDAAARLASDNAGILRQKLGREPTAGELYLAHQQGAGGAAALLANPDAPAASIVGASAVTANGGTSDMTAGQFASKWTGKFGSPAGGAPAAAAAASNGYGAQPLNIAGRMLTRAQAENTDGIDHTDYDDAAAKAGLISNAAAAPAYSEAPAASPPSVPGAPSTAVPAASAAPASGGVDRTTLLAVLNDPYTSPQMAQVAGQLLAQQMKPKDTFSAPYRDEYGNIVQREQSGKIDILNNAKDTKEGGSGAHVIGPGGALVDNSGKALFQNSGTEGSLDDQTTEFLAQRVHEGDTTALVGLGRGAQGAANIAKVQKRAAQISADAMGKPKVDTPATEVIQNQADRAGTMAGARASGTLNARLDTYAKEAGGAMDLAIDQSRELPRTTWVPVNKMIQAVQSGASDPHLASFVAANNAVINTYAKAINPNGVPTVSDKAHASEVLATAQSPEAYEATVRQLQREINIAHNAARGARDAERTGEAAKDIAVTPQTGAPGSTSRGVVDMVLHPFGGGGTAATDDPAKISSVDDYNALPKGARYIDPEGNSRTKR